MNLIYGMTFWTLVRLWLGDIPNFCEAEIIYLLKNNYIKGPEGIDELRECQQHIKLTSKGIKFLENARDCEFEQLAIEHLSLEFITDILIKIRAKTHSANDPYARELEVMNLIERSPSLKLTSRGELLFNYGFRNINQEKFLLNLIDNISISPHSLALKQYIWAIPKAEWGWILGKLNSGEMKETIVKILKN